LVQVQRTELSQQLLVSLLQVQKRSGVRIEVIPETPEGDISIPHLQQLLAQQVGCPGLHNCKIDREQQLLSRMETAACAVM
jgi:hypothetical protein